MTVSPIEPGTDIAVVDPAPVVLEGEYLQLLAYEAYCAGAAAHWKKERERYRARIQEILGDATVGVDVRGDQLVTYAPKEVMRTQDFARDYPALHKLYTRPKVVDQFDVEALKRERPELYRQYQSRALINKVEPATAPEPPPL